jgi:hypothetical protein
MDTRTDDPLTDLKSQVAAQGLLLRALAKSHPDPQALRAQLRALRADDVAQHYNAHPHYNVLDERTRAYVQALCDDIHEGSG